MNRVEKENLSTGAGSSPAIDPVQDECKKYVQNTFHNFSIRNHERAQELTLSVFHGWNIEEMSAFLGRTRSAMHEYLSQYCKILCCNVPLNENNEASWQLEILISYKPSDAIILTFLELWRLEETENDWTRLKL